MDIIVLLKQVPDLVEELELDATGTRVDRERVRHVLNEFDDHALEQALLLKEKQGGQVSALALDRGNVDESLYTAIAKGADRAVKITGAFEHVDTHTAAQVFHSILKTLSYDLILTGVQAVDDLDGQLGPMLAAMLKLPYVGVVTGVTIDGACCTVLKEYPGGVRAELEVSLPAVLGIQAAEKPPRYVPMARLRQAMKSAKIEEMPAELPSGAGLSVRRLFKPEAAGRAEILSGTPEEAVSQLIRILREKGLIKG
ncbi:MAG: electron transfer flavoprotein subunit beta/FixA family protein [Candidatus Bipolaricaulia bacterium]